MKAGIFSDTHNNLDGIQAAIKVFKEHKVEFLLHAGDWVSDEAFLAIAEGANQLNAQLIGVFGNNDSPGELHEANANMSAPAMIKDFIEITMNGRSIAIHHGHKKTIERMLLQTQPDVIIRGHSHKAKLATTDKTLHINPGSTSHGIPRRRDYQPTVAVYDARLNQAKIIGIAVV